MDVEKWLEENAITCSRFEMRISPATCARYQEQWPLRCVGCEQAGSQTQATAPTPQQKGGRASKGRHCARHGASPYSTHYQAKESGEMAREILCACGCGRRGKVMARGLIATCYNKAAKEGRLSQFKTRQDVRPDPAEANVDHVSDDGEKAPELKPSVGEMLAPENDPALREQVPAAAIADKPLNGHGEGVCRCGCGTVGRIHGRGLVKQCYDHHKRAGTLGQFAPLIKSHRAPETPTKAISVTLVFEPERDGDMYHCLVERAHLERRPIELQILAILDDYFAEQAYGEGYV